MTRSVEVVRGSTSRGLWVLFDCETKVGIAERFEFTSRKGRLTTGGTSVPLAVDEPARLSQIGSLEGDFVTIRCAADIQELTLKYVDGSTSTIMTSPVSPVSGDRFVVFALEPDQIADTLFTAGTFGATVHPVPQLQRYHNRPPP